MPKVLVCPQSTKASIVDIQKIPNYEEYLVISPSHTVLYNINYKEQRTNINFEMYPYSIVSGIIGDAIICQNDSDGNEIDIDPNILDNLTFLLVRDMEQRQAYRNMLGNIVRI